MPELPEVRVHAERLAADYTGVTLSGTRAISFTALKTYEPPPEAAVGEAITAIASRGKFLTLSFESVAFLVHLMQGGRLVVDTKMSAKPRGGMFRWSFEGRDPLLLTEAGSERKAGVWVVTSPAIEAEALAHLGPEADTLDADALDRLLDDAGGSRLHGVLRDQHRLAGIGRRLANEICWTAHISPFAPAAKLQPAERAALLDAIGRCIADSIEDERGRDVMVRSAERLSRVHHRSGQPCERCGDIIREVAYNAYTVHYCAACQTGGKVLADNTTSKFLK